MFRISWIQQNSMRDKLEQDESETNLRVAEVVILLLKEDCDAAHKDLAFWESELKETRLELNVEKKKNVLCY